MRRFILLLVLTMASQAQSGPVGLKTIPPPGIPVPAADRAELQAGLARLTQTLEPLRANPLYPDAAIYAKAVRFALEGDEFFKPAEIASAKELLKQGQDRANSLAGGAAPWQSATGLVVRAYTSKIDGSLQPYGLVIPPSFAPDRPHKWRLDLWFHGRSETLSEVNFITDRQKNAGEFTPRDTIVLHLYGRYCNASKFAGEVDLFEALDDVKTHYNIDERRISVRGFSMGGAAVWHIAAHHAGLWAAAAPGAGFAETREFVPAFHKQEITPTWYQEKLWHLTDATDYALNFAQLPVVAYNGEIDPQQQAADIMARYLAREGMMLTRVVGPNTAHKYHPASRIEINRLIDPIVERGNEPTPRKIHFTTWTLAYNEMKWITVDGLEKHWERARVDAEITNDQAVQVQTSNISSLTLRFGPGTAPFDATKKLMVMLDGQALEVPGPDTARGLSASFHKQSGKWVPREDTSFRKRHNLQGPIDDAFLSSFVMVLPTGTPKYPAMAGWVQSEEAHAIREWRRQFRGDAPEKKDTEITDADIANSNLVLWGDEDSNRVYARIAAKLPLKWPDGNHALVMIYPNPLNPKKYVVLNSGVTFREEAYASNALQTAKLPDWAILDANGKVTDANFFGESWERTAK